MRISLTHQHPDNSLEYSDISVIRCVCARALTGINYNSQMLGLNLMHVQIVKFKLKSSSSRQEFLELTKQMISILKNMDGFVAYELYEGSECWMDRIAWKSIKHAQEGQNAFLATSIAELIIPLVESDYSSFFGEAVVSS